jgi:hypothetical protein
MRLTRLLAASAYNRTETAGEARLDQNRRLILDCLARAEAFNPDFVVFPEIMLHQGVGPMPEAVAFAETVPGPLTEAVAERARVLDSHVILPLLEKCGDKVYNSAVLLGRDGAHIGTYRKFYATGYEIEDGVQPGDEVRVWETDRGRIGSMICFDLEFSDVAVALARGGADIVFWPTMFPGGQRVPAWAVTYGFFIVTCGGGYGELIDPMGRTVAKNGPIIHAGDSCGEVRWTVAEVNTDFRMYHTDFNREKLPDIVNRYGDGVEQHFAGEEGRFTIASRMPDVTVADIESEFGLTPLREYLDSATRIREKRLGSS